MPWFVISGGGVIPDKKVEAFTVFDIKRSWDSDAWNHAPEWLKRARVEGRLIYDLRAPRGPLKLRGAYGWHDLSDGQWLSNWDGDGDIAMHSEQPGEQMSATDVRVVRCRLKGWGPIDIEAIQARDIIRVLSSPPSDRVGWPAWFSRAVHREDIKAIDGRLHVEHLRASSCVSRAIAPDDWIFMPLPTLPHWASDTRRDRIHTVTDAGFREDKIQPDAVAAAEGEAPTPVVVRLGVRMSDDVKAELKAIADKRGKTVPEILEQIGLKDDGAVATGGEDPNFIAPVRDGAAWISELETMGQRASDAHDRAAVTRYRRVMEAKIEATERAGEQPLLEFYDGVGRIVIEFSNVTTTIEHGRDGVVMAVREPHAKRRTLHDMMRKYPTLAWWAPDAHSYGLTTTAQQATHDDAMVKMRDHAIGKIAATGHTSTDPRRPRALAIARACAASYRPSYYTEGVPFDPHEWVMAAVIGGMGEGEKLGATERHRIQRELDRVTEIQKRSEAERTISIADMDQVSSTSRGRLVHELQGEVHSLRKQVHKIKTELEALTKREETSREALAIAVDAAQSAIRERDAAMKSEVANRVAAELRPFGGTASNARRCMSSLGCTLPIGHDGVCVAVTP